MTSYRLTEQAENDIRELARHTLKTWGKSMLDEYRAGLMQAFSEIGSGCSVSKAFSRRFPNLRVTKYRHYHAFFLVHESDTPIIIAVLHERRDIVAALDDRLKNPGH